MTLLCPQNAALPSPSWHGLYAVQQEQAVAERWLVQHSYETKFVSGNDDPQLSNFST